MLRFISEPIEPVFDRPPGLRKKPPCPDGFEWRGRQYRVTALLGQWTDRARLSWGQGRIYFEVATDSGRAFRIYYDRRPKDAEQRQGEWVVYGEVCEEESR